MPTDDELSQAIDDTVKILVSLRYKHYPFEEWDNAPAALNGLEAQVHKVCSTRSDLFASVIDFFNRQGAHSMEDLRTLSTLHHLYDVLVTIHWMGRGLDQRPEQHPINESLSQVCELVVYVLLSNVDELLDYWWD